MSQTQYSKLLKTGLDTQVTVFQLKPNQSNGAMTEFCKWKSTQTLVLIGCEPRENLKTASNCAIKSPLTAHLGQNRDKLSDFRITQGLAKPVRTRDEQDLTMLSPVIASISHALRN